MKAVRWCLFSWIALMFLSQGISLAVENQARVGSVHVAVIGVARWDEVKASLQPKFKMDEETALAKAIPTTLAQYQELLDSIKLSLKLAPPATTVTGKETYALDETGAEIKTSQTTAETKSGDTAQAAGTSATSAGRIYDKPPFSAAPTAYDAVTMYQNARTLYQIIALLNRSITDAATKRDCTPYIVTLQISLMPYRSSLPYDAYSTISFFSGGPAGAPPLRKEGDPAAASKEPSVLPNPYIVPLLSTDNMEAGSDIRASNEIGQLSLALIAMIKGFGASSGLDKTSQRINAAAGNALNSLLTVGRLTDNTIQIRLGAMLQPSNAAKRAMVPRTHNISILVLVPKSVVTDKMDPGIHAATRTVFRNAETGKALDPKPSWLQEKQIIEALRPYGISFPVGRDSYQTIREAQEALQRNDFPTFRSKMNDLFEDKPAPSIESIWIDLTRLWIGGQYAQVGIELPQKPKTVWPDTAQTVVCEDDQKAKSTIRIKGGQNLPGDGHYQAVLILPIEGKECRIAADQIEIQNQSAIQASFPSLKTLGAFPKGLLGHVSLRLTWKSGEDSGEERPYENIFYHPLDAGSAPATPAMDYIEAGLDHVLVSQGKGSIAILVSDLHDGKNLVLAASGCTIKSVAPDGILGKPEGFLYPILKKGKIILELDDLIAGSSMKLEVRKEKAIVDSVELKVAARQPPDK